MYFTVREPDDPQGVLEEYIKALDNGQCEKAISHVDLGGMSREEFISTCEQLDVEVESVDVTDVSPDGEIVWVTVKVNMTSDEGLWSTNEPTRVPVHRVDGEWKVLATWQTANAG